MFFVGDSQQLKEPDEGAVSGETPPLGDEAVETTNNVDSEKEKNSGTSQVGGGGNDDQERVQAIAGLPMGLGLVASDFSRLQANAREILGLASPVRRTLFGGGASAAPPTPFNHSTPQVPPPLERSRSGLSTDGEFLELWCF